MRFVLAPMLLVLAGCSSAGSVHDMGSVSEVDLPPELAKPIPASPRETVGQQTLRARLIESVIRSFGRESRQIFGADTDTFPVTWTLFRRESDGSLTKVYQEIDVAHAEVGLESGRKLLYRVGMISGRPHILLRSKDGYRRFEVLWESWPDNMRREGNPPSKYIRYFFNK